MKSGGINLFEELTLTNALAIDVEPKYGKWIVKKAPNRGYGNIFICPFCGSDVECVPTNFCPNCGTNMREREVSDDSRRTNKET